MNPISVLDYMISHNLTKYTCNPWYAKPGPEHFTEANQLPTQVNYKDETFIVVKKSGHHGMGGMDQGSPDTVEIIKVL